MGVDQAAGCDAVDVVPDPGLGRGVAGFAVRMLPDAISLGSLHYVMIVVPVWVHFVSTDGVLTNIATGGHSLVEGWEISSGEQVRSSSFKVDRRGCVDWPRDGESL